MIEITTRRKFLDVPMVASGSRAFFVYHANPMPRSPLLLTSWKFPHTSYRQRGSSVEVEKPLNCIQLRIALNSLIKNSSISRVDPSDVAPLKRHIP